MNRFRQTETLQTFASVHTSVHDRFPTERLVQNPNAYKKARTAAIAECCGLLAA